MRRLLTLVLAALAITLSGGYTLAAELSGRVTNAETKAPIGGATVRVLETGQSVPSDKYGSFTLTGLDDGTYSLLVSHVAFDQSDTLLIRIPGVTTLSLPLSPTPWFLDNVVVTGTRSPHLLKDVPVQTEVVTARDFHRTGSVTVDEALTSSIGITIDDDLSGKGATLRGIQGDRVLVLVDGERSVGRVRGSIDLGQFSLSNVEKIEVVKGTGSTLYGSEAMGGVINIITRKPSYGKASAGLQLDYGTHNSYNPAAHFDYGSDQVGLSIGGKLSSTDGFDLDDSTPHTRGEEETDRWNLDGKLRARLSQKWSITTTARFMHEKKKWIEYEYRDAYNEYTYDDVETNKRYESSVAAQYLSGDKYSMNLRVSGTLYDHYFTKFNGPYWVDTSDTQDQFIELSYSSNYVIAESHVMTYGFDLNSQDLKSPSLADGKQADRAFSGYFQYEYSPIKPLNFLPGVRYENHSSFGGHVNPSINIMYSVGEQLKFRGFIGKGFRAPSIKEQFFIFDHTAAGYIVYGGSVPIPSELGSLPNHRELKQENSINSSISAEFSYGAIGLHRITYFYNHLDDLIEFIRVDTSFPDPYYRGVYAYQNIERAITQGIEWESRVRLTRAIDFSFSYNYLYTRDLTELRELINRPAHTLKFNLTAMHSLTGLGFSVWGDYQSRKLWEPRTNTGGNEGEHGDKYAPARARLNLNLFKRFTSGIEAFVRFENVFDRTNWEYGYWPGFEVFAGFKYDISLDNFINN